MSPVDRSLYSLPAMLDGRGTIVRPDFVALEPKIAAFRDWLMEQVAR